MATLYETLGSKYTAYGTPERTALAKEAGIANYVGSAEQNNQLVAYLTKKNAPPTSSNINDKINQNQYTNFNNASSSSTPETRKSAKTYDEIYNEITSSLTKNLPAKPEVVDLTQKYKELMSGSDITTLETSLNDLQKQARDIQAISQARTSAEKNKAVPMNVIAGRVSEEENQDNQRLQAVNNSIKTITDQLTMKYNVIDNIMKYTGQDYTNSVDSYDKQFSNNLSLMTQARGIAQDQLSIQEKEADDARANLQIIYNSMPAGGITDPAQKANITKLELQAGLPVGFYENITAKNQDADILSTTTRETGGVKYADVIMRNKDGSLSTKTVRLGSSTSGSGGGTEAEKTRIAISSMGQDLAGMAKNGYVTLEQYKQARDLWSNQAGRSSDEFDKNFKRYLNPDQYYEAGLSY